MWVYTFSYLIKRVHTGVVDGGNMGEKVAQTHVKLNKMRNLHEAHKKALKRHEKFSVAIKNVTFCWLLNANWLWVMQISAISWLYVD